MAKQGDIEKRVDQVLSSLDQVKRAEANPFLYTRIEQALNKNEEKTGILAIFNRPAFAIGGLVLVILMNSVIFLRHSDTPTNTSANANQDDEQLFAREYSYGVSTADRFYSLNEVQP